MLLFVSIFFLFVLYCLCFACFASPFLLRSLWHQYPEYLKFVGTHHEGRYSSYYNRSTYSYTSLEEDPQGIISWYLLTTKQGVHKSIDHEPGWWMEVPVEELFSLNPTQTAWPVFMNLQADGYERFADRHADYNYTEYNRRVCEYLDIVFPPFLEPSAAACPLCHRRDAPFCAVTTLNGAAVPPFGKAWAPTGRNPRYDNQRGVCAFQRSHHRQGPRNLSDLVPALVRACNRRRPRRSAPAAFPDCPAVNATLVRLRATGEVRSVKQCQTDQGGWGGAYTPSLECVVQYFARHPTLLPGDLVLDLGSACGHFGAWLHAYWGARVFGLDISPEAVQAANANRVGDSRYCVGDASDLAFIGDGIFDGVFAFAVMYHLPWELQCKALREAVRVTRKGGKIYFGWNGEHLGHSISPDPRGPFWGECLKGTPVAKFSIVYEAQEAIGDWGLGVLDENAFGHGIPNYGVEVLV